MSLFSQNYNLHNTFYALYYIGEIHMTTIKELQQLNPDLPIRTIKSPSFARYGKEIKDFDFSEYLHIMKKRTIPDEGNIYVSNDTALTNCAVSAHLSSLCYGEMPIQVGFCNGNGNTLNALEYHKSSEINIAITPLVLLLGHLSDITANTYSAELVEAFYLPAGSACELYSTTLHFAPCKVDNNGFKCLVILPLGTNEPLDLNRPLKDTTEPLLWMRNKWLIAHPDSRPATLGAHAGITGPNIELKYNR